MADNNESGNGSIDFEDLSEKQKEKLASNPDIRKMLEYEESPIPDLVDSIREMQENDDFEMGESSRDVASDGLYSLFVEDIADKGGRTTPSTVHTVLSAAIEAYEETNN